MMYVILATVNGEDHVFSSDETHLTLTQVGEEGFVRGALSFPTEEKAKEMIETIRLLDPELEDSCGPFGVGRMEPFH